MQLIVPIHVHPDISRTAVAPDDNFAIHFVDLNTFFLACPHHEENATRAAKINCLNNRQIKRKIILQVILRQVKN